MIKQVGHVYPGLRRSKTYYVMLVSDLTETAKAKAIARTPPGSVVGSQGR